jgi:hypothetical protein
MVLRHTLVLVGIVASFTAARAQGFHIEEMSSPSNWTLDQLKPGTIEFNDHIGGGADTPAGLISFADWARQNPIQKKFLSLYAGYTEPTKVAKGKADPTPAPDKLYMYVAQARFLVNQAPGSIDLSHYVTLQFLQQIDPAIKHTLITPADVKPFKGENSAGNDNPNRKWCTGRTTSICIQSTYKLEGKIPLGIMLVNKLRDSSKKIADHIDFQSELSALSTTDVDQAGLQQLTGLDAPISGVLEQNIFYVNQVMRFAKFFAVFQGDPSDANKTVVTAFMALAIEASVLDKKREYENVPVLRNLVPADVLMGQSSFNSGNSISAGLPKYARNEITTVAGLLEKNKN